jgi:hypothetical protein
MGAVSGVIPFMFWLAGTLGLIGLTVGFIARGRVKRGEATNGPAALWGSSPARWHSCSRSSG